MTLYAVHERAIFDGKYGKVARVQAVLDGMARGCGSPGLKANGVFDANSARSVKAVAACPVLKEKLPDDSPAFKGALTLELWKQLLPDVPPPSADERAQSLVLTYEATDYDHLEWNFCQSKPLWSPAHPEKTCFSNDRSSFVTWGPRGATAGGGQEVQWIVARVDASDPALVDQAFGSEAGALRKLVHLNGESAQRLLCSVFADEPRRAAWTNGFARFGSFAAVRTAYQQHYASAVSDAAKMQSFYKLYRKLGVAPTEVDYGFFLDRSTQSSPPRDLDATAMKIRKFLSSNGLPLTPPNVRRAFSQLFPTSNVDDDRLGRDVAFFVDAISEAGLTKKETRAWNKKWRMRASDVGLSDARPAPTLSIAPTIDSPGFAEALSPLPPCPASLLHPVHPPKPAA
ncbi:hypothetical protein [Burkholderia sp. S-53]|uniref:hypothetical protein n=1 Tax=Burkholderia sp. S-53 TaxID=2906514 RepID=UPI0021CF3EE5|nr:hypothetical protein [Burkholderia sp. S-53]UXU85620.1 hypothetical protein LXM88_04440 [Burkholderia sp. S-53]